MVMTTIRGKNRLQNLSVNEFVESIISHFGHNILLKEEHISRTDKLKKYRQYQNGREVKDELSNMLDKFVTKYNTNDYVRKVDFYASKQEGLSNYIELTFNTPFGSKEWLKHMKIRVSDHPKMNDRKVDEYIYLEGKSVEDIEKELDRIVNKRIRRLEREFNIPMVQNESLRRKHSMKLRINESNYNHKKYNLLTKTEYDYWYNAGINAFDNGERCVPAYNKEIVDYMTKHSAKIGSDESRKSNQIAKAWTDGWTFRNLYVD